MMSVAFSTSADRDEETALLFSYKMAGPQYINVMYSEGTFYLPLSELFSLLCLYHEVDKPENIVKGKLYNPEMEWRLDFNSYKAETGREDFVFSAEDVRFVNGDFYLKPDLFEIFFDLRFGINMSTLTMTLSYNGELPVEEKKRRERMRMEIAGRGKKEDNCITVAFPRKRELFEPGVVDYSIGIVSGNGSRSLNCLVKGGAEVMGGGLSGGVSGRYFQNSYRTKAVNTVWEYDFKENPLVTSFRAGQLYSDGIFKRRITGVALTNEPLTPRRHCNGHIIEGHTDPGSEVELYLNNRLSAFSYADEHGFYRFEFPLSYGSVRTKVKIYKPDGEMVSLHGRIITPYDFLPENNVSYNVNAGILSNDISVPYKGKLFYQGYIARGITRNITIKGGAACFNGGEGIHCYSSVTARVREKYLINIDVAPGILYKTGIEGYYYRGPKWKISYSCFADKRLLNFRMAEDELFASLFLPWVFSESKSGFRMSWRHNRFDNGTGNDFSGGLTFRLRRFSLRLDYRGRLNRCYGTESYADGSVFASSGYLFSGMQHIPSILRGVMLNARTVYDPCTSHVNSAGLRISKSFPGRGRFFVDMGYRPPIRSLSLQAGMNIDLNIFRLSSAFLQMGKDYLSRHTISGSVASLPAGGKAMFSDRWQVGLAGVSVLMFVDSNQNGEFDKDEKIIPSKAVRLNRSAEMKLSPEGILHIKRLMRCQSYELEVIQSGLPDPMLAPLKCRFSFTADPNRYKLIKIPLYRTGVVEGSVSLQNDQLYQPMGGIKVIIEDVANADKKIVRTFSDGTFYSMGILPGRYILRLDRNQLDSMNLASSPVEIEVEVKALADGDFLKGIDFILVKNSLINDRGITDH